MASFHHFRCWGIIGETPREVRKDRKPLQSQLHFLEHSSVALGHMGFNRRMCNLVNKIPCLIINLLGFEFQLCHAACCVTCYSLCFLMSEE